MDEAAFIVELVRALAWPATVLLVAWWFREPLAILIGRVDEASVGGAGVSVGFRRQLERAARRLPDAGALPHAVPGDGPGAAPASAIEAAWADTREALRRAAAPPSDAAIASAGELAALHERARRTPAALTAADAVAFVAVAARLRAALEG